MTGRHRVLFVAEAVTLAHVARPIALASRLNADEFESVIACAPRYRDFFPRAGPSIRDVNSISGAKFLERLAEGRPVYDLSTLRGYVADDLRALDEVKPSVVVGDFRLSLAVSARLRNVPYVSITNAYWSPFARPKFEMPSLPIARVLGQRVASALFRAARPLAFAYHATPMNRLRREFKVASLGFDLRRVYTEADYVAYADVPALIPTSGLPKRHYYIGPVLWSPPVPLPSWWETLPKDSPLIFVTMGSSGDAKILPIIIDALAAIRATVVIASAGARLPEHLPGNARCAQFLPGDVIAQRASLVICNGGSPTTHQALAKGVPVLGIATNMDQFLNMHFIVAQRAGVRLRSDTVAANEVADVARTMLASPAFTSAAQRLAAEMRAYDAPMRLAAILRSAIARQEANL